MTTTQKHAQETLNKAYFAFIANQQSKALAKAYLKARNALFLALSHKN